ncbi:hypothetical protein P3T16_002586 [Paraburkholderia sp. GAS42]
MATAETVSTAIVRGAGAGFAFAVAAKAIVASRRAIR